MIYDYAIKKINNEEILYIYLDFNNEFAKLNAKNKKKKLKEEINDFIKKNNIKNAPKKVALVAGGLLIGTLLINNINTNINDNYISTDVSPISILLKQEEENSLDESINEIIEDNEVEEVKEVEKNEVKQNVVKESKKVVTSEGVKDSSNNTVDENKEYVTVYRSNGKVINVELEEYIVGVVSAEMPAEFHEKALMAQAIIARTYTLKNIQNNKKITDSSSTQNYKSKDELKSMWGSNFDKYYQKISNAVYKTKGKYLTYNGELIEAVYHSTSNGMTENSINVWGNSYPYLVSVESNYDSSNPSFYKEELVTYDILSSKLNMEINENTEFNIISKTTGNRVDKISINGNTYTGVYIRNLLGLRSADFEITKNDSGWLFATKGYGHGVGMSQYGANGMAKNGYTYEAILTHYYPGVTING